MSIFYIKINTTNITISERPYVTFDYLNRCTIKLTENIYKNGIDRYFIIDKFNLIKDGNQFDFLPLDIQEIILLDSIN